MMRSAPAWSPRTVSKRLAKLGLIVAPLLTGTLLDVSCGQIARQSLYLGTLEFISGQVSNTFNFLAPLSDLIIGTVTGSSTQTQ